MSTTPSNRPPFYKKLLLVNWKYQGLLTAYGLLIGFVMLLMSLRFQWLYSSPDTTQTTFYLHVAGALVVFLVLIYLGFIITHKMFGPLLRVQTHLRKWQDTGVWEPPQIRKSDFLHEFVDELNTTIEKNIPKK